MTSEPPGELTRGSDGQTPSGTRDNTHMHATLFITATVFLLAAIMVGLFEFSRLTTNMGKTARVSFTALGLMLASCNVSGCSALGVSPTMAKNTLSGVASRVDVARLIECGGAESMREVAKCLGARALTEGLEEAIHQAQRLAEDAELAENPGAGADDLSDEQRGALASELDVALDHLGEEIAIANAL